MIFHVLLAFSVTLGVLLILTKTRLAEIALDQPNHRSLHTQLTPRTGGIAVMAGVLSAWLLADVSWLWVIPVCFLLAVSLLDDLRNLPVRWRLLAQLITSAAMAWILLPEHHWWLQTLAMLAITWMINLYNFMDGSDGLAGGMALLGFGSYAIAAWMGGDPQLASMNVAITAASLAFLLLNFHPARIFLGDGGSVPLGFLAGAIGLYGWQNGTWPGWFPLLVFSPFIVDATVVLLKRTFLAERIWEAHHDHYYQRLVRMGWGHRKTAVMEYALMISAGATAIALKDQEGLVVLVVLGGWLAAYVLIMLSIDKCWSATCRASHKSG